MATQAQFEHEEVAAVPRGWKVRTVAQDGGTRVRVAFPPGRRRKGSGKLISILHPIENRLSIAQGWDSAGAAYRTRVLQAAGVSDAGKYASASWKDLPREVRNAVSGKRNAFDTDRERAAYVAGLRHGGSTMSGALEKLGAKRATRVERMMRSGLGRKNAKRNQLATVLTEAAAVKGLLPSKKSNAKTKTREQVEAMQAKAVRFLEDVVRDEDKAGEIERMSVEEYAAKKKITLQNPRRYSVVEESRRGYFYLANLDSLSEAKAFAKEHHRDRPQLTHLVLDNEPSDPKKAGETVFKLARQANAKNHYPGCRGNADETAEAVRLYEEFHGRRPDQVQELQERDVARDTYSTLGDLLELRFNKSGEKYKLEFEGCRVKLAQSAKGEQLYLIGGDQNCDAFLKDGSGKDFVSLGTVDAVTYITRKSFDSFKESAYQHKFGEEGGEKPWGLYNTLAKRIFIVDGSYRIEAPGIID